MTFSSYHTAAHYTVCLYQRETNIKVSPLYFRLNAGSSRELKDFIMGSDTTFCILLGPILSKLNNILWVFKRLYIKYLINIHSATLEAEALVPGYNFYQNE